MFVSIFLLTQLIGVYCTCPSRTTTTDVQNLITKTNVTTEWIEGGFAYVDDKNWVSISTSLTGFTNASVFISIPTIAGETSNDGFPAIPRVRSVVSSGQVQFQVKIYQANDSYCSKQWHSPTYITPPIELQWLVVEQGAFLILNKYRVMVGKGPITRADNVVTNANNFIRFNYPVGCETSTDSCRFPNGASPAVIAQLQTVLYDRLLIPRVRSIALSFVRFVLQPHDSTTASYYTLSTPETLAYLAYQSNMSVSCIEGLAFEGRLLSNVAEIKVHIGFTNTYYVPPGIFGIVGSTISLTDSTGLRVFNRTTTGVNIITQEDQCVDEETSHTTGETVFTLAIGAQSNSPSCTICQARFTSSYNQPTYKPTSAPTARPTLSPTKTIIGSYMSNATVTTFRWEAGTHGLSISSDGTFALITHNVQHVIRHLTISTNVAINLAGKAGTEGAIDGVGTFAQFKQPCGVAISLDGSYALIADSGNHLLRKIVISTATVYPIAGYGGLYGATNGVGTNVRFNYPFEISFSPDYSYALIADRNQYLIRKIDISTGSISTVAGVSGSSGSTNGIGSNALFYNPSGIAISPDGVFALITDCDNHLVRQLTISTSSVTTVAGVSGTSGSTNGIGTNSKFYKPYRIAISPDGVYALITDNLNLIVRQLVLSTSTISTIAGVVGSSTRINGIGTHARFNSPLDVKFSPDQTYAFINDGSDSNIYLRKLQPISTPTYKPTLKPTSKPT